MNEHDLEQIAALVANKKHLPGALLPILHDIQEHYSFIPTQAIAIIAKQLKLSAAEVHGVISFYHHFRSSQPGRHVVEICRAEACQAMGSRGLESHAQKRLNTDFGETSQDNKVTLASVYCLGNCACAPSVKVGDKVYGRVTAEKFDQLIAELDVQTLELSGSELNGGQG
jgi:formate dehydrogenase subunit gamma